MSRKKEKTSSEAIKKCAKKAKRLKKLKIFQINLKMKRKNSNKCILKGNKKEKQKLMK